LDDRGSAENYQTSTFLRVLEKLTPILEGTPRVENDQAGMTTLRDQFPPFRAPIERPTRERPRNIGVSLEGGRAWIRRSPF
jgi:hypothetical protein